MAAISCDCGQPLNGNERYCSRCGRILQISYVQSLAPSSLGQGQNVFDFLKQHLPAVFFGLCSLLLIISSFTPWYTGVFGNSYNAWGGAGGPIFFGLFIGYALAAFLVERPRPQRRAFLMMIVLSSLVLCLALILLAAVFVNVNESHDNWMATGDILTAGPGAFIALLGVILGLVGSIVGFHRCGKSMIYAPYAFPPSKVA
jgi:hypothetical protein